MGGDLQFHGQNWFEFKTDHEFYLEMQRGSKAFDNQVLEYFYFHK